MKRALRRGGSLLGIAEDERTIVALSALLFFVLMGGYFLIRPVRDALGAAGGVRQLESLIFINAGVMLLAAPVYAWGVRSMARRTFVTVVMRLFAVVLLSFFMVFLWSGIEGAGAVWPGRVFFVWVSVYNLFLVSIFWSVMSDCFHFEPSKRLFGLISIGGTLGAIGASAIMGTLASWEPLVGVGVPVWAMLISAGSLEVVVRLFRAIDARRPISEECAQSAISPSLISGLTSTLRSPYLLGICAYITLSSTVWTLLYIEQIRLVAMHVPESDGRIALFARIDVAYNAIALVLQLLAAGHVMKRFGVGFALALLPAIGVIGFLAVAVLSDREGTWIGYAPVIWGLVIFQVVRRGVQYGINKPARSTLFTVVGRDERYKAKSFIDTYVYRTGDAAGAGLSRWLASTVSGTPYVAAGLSMLWMASGIALGISQRKRAGMRTDDEIDGPVSPVLTPVFAAKGGTPSS